MASSFRGLIDRDREIEFFHEIIGQGRPLLWPIHGPGGIGKTWLIEHFRDDAAERGFGTLHFDWDHQRQDYPDKINAVSLWRSVSVGSERHNPSKRAFKRFQVIRNALHVNPETQAVEYAPEAIKRLDQVVQQDLDQLIEKSDKLGAFAIAPKFLSSLTKWLYSLRKKQIQANPEKTLLEELMGFARKRLAVFLLDNHDLAAAIEVHTRLGGVDSTGFPQWFNNPAAISFREYLERFHAAVYAETGVRWITIVTGRAELPFFPSLPAEVWSKPNHLRAFSQHGIHRRLKQEAGISEYLTAPTGTSSGDRSGDSRGEEMLSRVALDMLKLTRGNPLLVDLAAKLLVLSLAEANPETDTVSKVWEREINRFRGSPNVGFHLFVSDRLVKRMEQSERVRDAIWRLVLPYRIWDDSKLEEILFPRPESLAETSGKRLFEQLQELGMLKPFRDQPRRLSLHLVNFVVLKELAKTHADECAGLHRQMEAYFAERGEKDAETYHHLCGRERERFRELDLGIGPEDYWEMTQASLTLPEKDRKRFLFQKLPAKRTLKQRVDQLMAEEKALGTEGFCGDAALFLRRKFVEGALQPDQFNELAMVETLIRKAPHLSDLHFKAAMLETDPARRYERVWKITEEINSAHAYAWWHRGHWELANDEREAAFRSFQEAISYGVFGFHLDYAQGMVAWMEADHAVAVQALERAYEVRPKGELRLALASLLVYLEKFDRALGVLKDSRPQDLRALFLRIEGEYRSGNDQYVKALFEEWKGLETPASWMAKRVEQIEGTFRRKEEHPSEVREDGHGHLGVISPLDGNLSTIRSSMEGHGNFEGDDEKLKDLKERVERNPKDFEAWFEFGNALADQGRYGEAETAFEKALEIKPDDHEAWKKFGNTLFEQGRYGEAETAYEKALDIKPDHYKAWYSLGLAFANQGRYREAETAYEKALEIIPDFHEAWYSLGIALRNQGRYGAAQIAYQKVLEIEPFKPQAWSNLGGALYNQGRYGEAETAYRKAVEIKPDLHEAWNNLGHALGGHGQYGEAEILFKKALEIKPDFHEAWNNLGLSFQNQGRYQEAKNAFGKALEIKPEYYEALSNTGVALYNQGRYGEAETSFEKVIEIKPNEYGAWHNLGVLKERSVGPGAGQEYLAISRAIKLTSLEAGDDRYEADPDDWLLVGRKVWADHGDWEKALECVQQVLKIEPQNPDALTLAAEAHLELENLTEAQGHLDLLEQIQPDYAPAYFPYGKFLLRQGRPEEAREKLRHAYDEHFIDSDDTATHLSFMEMFEQLDLPELALTCSLSLRAHGGREISEYHRARILWQTQKNLPEVRRAMEPFLHSDSPPMPQFLILDADIAMATGDFKRARKRLAEVREHEEFIYLSREERKWWERLEETCL
jgi:tetratricopeptide (TPR) repeat protein